MKQKDILFILISSFLFVIAWVIFSVYHNASTSTISQTLNQQIRPINPTFNAKAIQAIKKKLKVTPVYSIAAEVATKSQTIIVPNFAPLRKTGGVSPPLPLGSASAQTNQTISASSSVNTNQATSGGTLAR